MSKANIIEENPISMIQIKDELEKNKKKLGELNFRAAKTQEYLEQFSSLKVSEGKELIEKLKKLKIPRLRESHIYKVVDVLPHKVEMVKLLFQGTPLTISEDNCKKIVKVVEDYLPEKKPDKADKE